LRSDHAGELGTLYVYKRVVAFAQWRGDEEMFSFAKAHGITEVDYLKQIEQWLPDSQKS